VPIFLACPLLVLKRLHYRLFVVIGLLVGLVFATSFSFAQDNKDLEDEKAKVFTYTGKDGVVHELKCSGDEVIAAVVNKGSIQKVVRYNPKEGDIIVQLENKPIIKSVPFTFIKLLRLEIVFDEAPFLVIIHNRLDQGWDYSDPGTVISELLPEGIYDVMVLYTDCVTHVVKEGIHLVDNMSLNINKSEAVYTANITTNDEDGDEIDPDINDPAYSALFHKPSTTGTIILGWESRQYYLSPLSTDYVWEWSTQFFREDMDMDKLYSFNGYSNGCSSDLTFRNQQEDLKQMDYQYHVDPGVSEISVETHIGPIHGIRYFGCSCWTHELTYPFTQKAYYMRNPYPDFNFGGHIDYVFKFENNTPGELLYKTPMYAVEKFFGLGLDFIRGYIPHDGQNPIFQTTSGYTDIGYIDIGLSPPYWFGEFKNAAEEIGLRPFTGTWLWLYLNQAGDLRPHFNLGYQLYQGGSLIKQGYIDGIGVIYRTTIQLDDPGVYTLKVPYTDYYVRGLQGEALMSAAFDTSHAVDKNPPYMSHFNILCEGRPTNTIGFGKEAAVKFKVYDDNGLAQVSLYYRTGVGWWDILPLTNSGNQYSAQIPQLPVQSFVSLKLVADDIYGNKLTYKLNPAFFIKPTPMNPFQVKR
jgi:hypothetical protein